MTSLCSQGQVHLCKPPTTHSGACSSTSLFYVISFLLHQILPLTSEACYNGTCRHKYSPSATPFSCPLPLATHKDFSNVLSVCSLLCPLLRFPLVSQSTSIGVHALDTTETALKVTEVLPVPSPSPSATLLVTPSAFASWMLIPHFLASPQSSQVLSPCPKAQLWPLGDFSSYICSAGDPTQPTAVYNISAALTPESKGTCPLKAASPAHHLQLSVSNLKYPTLDSWFPARLKSHPSPWSSHMPFA